jgi:predicted dehydrogenase
MPSTSSRRQFLKAASAGAAALTVSASSYARIVGANDRISIGLIGCGDRGVKAHMPGVHAHAKTENVEITAVCDPWSVRREIASAQTREWYGRPARQFVSYRDLVALQDVDAVMIASPDHLHTTHLEAAAKAKKDVYCEKPLATEFAALKSACDAVRASQVVFQSGTQVCSSPAVRACREIVQSGVLGKISRIEQCRNGTVPYWYRYLKDAQEKDVDWREFLGDRPMRPFRGDVFTGWYGYRDFSGGPVPGFASHFIALVNCITRSRCPTSAVCHGGTFIWKDEHHFTCPDDVQATWIYPEEFLVSYSTNFGNGSGNCCRVYGDEGTLDLSNWNAPTVSNAGAGKKSRLGSETPVKPIEGPDHFQNWLQCIRSRKPTNGSIDSGYQHAVAVIMAMQAFDTGRRQVYHGEQRELREG